MNAYFKFPAAETVAMTAGVASIRWTKLAAVKMTGPVLPAAPELNVLSPLGPYFPVRVFAKCSLENRGK